MISDNFFKFTAWGVRKIGGGTLISLLLLLLVLGSIAAGLKSITAIQAETSLILVATLGLLTGWLLARSRAPGWGAATSGAAIGTIVIVIHTAQMGAKVLALLKELIGRGLSSLTWLPGEPLPDSSLIAILIRDIATTTANLFERLFTWLGALIAGAPNYDPLAATLLWAFFIWGVSAWAGWGVRRRADPLLAVLPGGALLASGAAFARGGTLFLIPLLCGALLLTAWVNFTRRVKHWDRAAIDYAEDIGFDLILWASAIVLGIVAVSTMVSFISPQKTLEFLSKLGGPRGDEVADLGESLGLQQNPIPEGGPGTGLAAGELPREHLLGSRPDLGLQVVMVIETDQALMMAPQASPGPPSPSYRWRALSYDLYTGRGWATSTTDENQYPANTSLPPIQGPAHRPMEQRVQFLEDIGNNVYVAGELVSVNQETEVAWRVAVTFDEPEVAETQPPDLFGARLEGLPGSRYQAISLVNVVGESQLRAAGEDYPDWVSERYLQLPDGMPQRVRELAGELTAGAETPYDKALALEHYLRQIPYSLDIPPPPADSDVADYFLFELRKGYCDYYATAMAALGRAIGVPTRLASGYAMGEYDETQERFIVTAKDAHSWVEVYFPGYGWVDFEPTGGLAAIIRPESVPVGQIPETAPQPPASPAGPWTNWLPWLAWAGLGIATLGILFMIWTLSDAWRLRRMPAELSSVRLYRGLFHQGSQLQVERRPGDTPQEFNLSLNQHIRGLSPSWRWQGQVDPAREESQLLVNLYNQAIYSPLPPDRGSARRAIRAWLRLRRRLWLARLLNALRGKRTKLG